MLKITKLIEITAGRLAIKTDMDFSERIRAFYEMINVEFTPEDLIFLLTCPEFALPESRNAGPWKPDLTVCGDRVQNWELKLSVLNRVVNSLTAAEGNTYRDRVFLTAFLGKLGVPDSNLFLERIASIKEASAGTVRLISLYWAGSSAVKAVSAGEDIGGDTLHRSVYRRLDTRMIYHDAERFYRAGYQMSGKIGRELLLLSAHVRAADQLLLTELREYVTGAPCPLHGFSNPYEIPGVTKRQIREAKANREEKSFYLKEETETINGLAAAALFNLAERSYHALTSAGAGEMKNEAYIELRPHPGRLASDTLERYFYNYMSAALYSETEEFFTWITRSAKKREAAILTLLLSSGEETVPPAGDRLQSDIGMTGENQLKKEILLWIRREERELHILPKGEIRLQREQREGKVEHVSESSLLSQSEVLTTGFGENGLVADSEVVGDIPEKRIFHMDAAGSLGTTDLFFRLQRLIATARGRIEKGEEQDRARLQSSLARLTYLSDFLAWEADEEMEGEDPSIQVFLKEKQQKPEGSRQKFEGRLDSLLRLTIKAEELFQNTVRAEAGVSLAGREAVSYIPEAVPLPVGLLGLAGGGKALAEDLQKVLETAGCDRFFPVRSNDVQSLKERMDQINEKNMLMQSKVKSCLEAAGLRTEAKQPVLPDRKRTREAALKALESPDIWLDNLRKMQKETRKPVWEPKVQAILEHTDGLTRYLFEQAAGRDKENGSRSDAMGMLLLDAKRSEGRAGRGSGRREKNVTFADGEGAGSRQRFLPGESGAAPGMDREAPLPPMVFRRSQEQLKELTVVGQGQNANSTVTQIRNEVRHPTAKGQRGQMKESDLSLPFDGRAWQTDAQIQKLIEKGLKRQIGDISEKVYERLEKRLKSEQIRRGR